jgi:hypothetical protein
MAVSSAKNTVSGAVRVTPLSSASARARAWKAASAAASCCAGVDAQRFGLVADHHARRQAAGAGNLDDVGQVVFAAGIVVADLGDQVEQQCLASAQITPELHRVMARSLGRGVLPFADRQQMSPLPWSAAAHSGPGRGVKAQDDDGMAGAGLEHGLQGFGADEGGVAIKHDGLAGASASRGGLRDGMGGAVAVRVLHHDLAPSS